MQIASSVRALSVTECILRLDSTMLPSTGAMQVKHMLILPKKTSFKMLIQFLGQCDCCMSFMSSDMLLRQCTR